MAAVFIPAPPPIDQQELDLSIAVDGDLCARWACPACGKRNISSKLDRGRCIECRLRVVINC